MDPAGERLRDVLTQLDTVSSAEIGELIRAHLSENKEIIRDLQEQLRASHEEIVIQAKRRLDTEHMLARRDSAYEELLGERARY